MWDQCLVDVDTFVPILLWIHSVAPVNGSHACVHLKNNRSLCNTVSM